MDIVETVIDMIKVNSLTKRYGDTLAVDTLNLSIQKGEIYGLLGPNGAGKTTTIRMLTTLTQPTSGKAWINGISIMERDMVTRLIGYLSETPPLYHELTANEQLNHAADLRDLPNDRSSEYIETLLTQLDLYEDADKRIAQYSKGMRQKTAFIQTILHEPAVVFLDEPTSGLDPRAARTLRDMIADLASDGTTIFLSTHMLSVVEELADTIGVLFDGQLVAEGTSAELKCRAKTSGQSTLEDAFLAITNEEPMRLSEDDDG